MSTILKFIVIFPILLILTACATIFSGTSQTVNIQAVDQQDNSILSDVNCIVTDGKGTSYPVTGNPGIITAARGNGTLQVNCKKDGYTQTNIGTGSSFNAVTIANVLFWPGFIIDGISGSYAKYPSHIVVQMAQEGA